MLRQSFFVASWSCNIEDGLKITVSTALKRSPLKCPDVVGTKESSAGHQPEEILHDLVEGFCIAVLLVHNVCEQAFG